MTLRRLRSVCMVLPPMMRETGWPMISSQIRRRIARDCRNACHKPIRRDDEQEAEGLDGAEPMDRFAVAIGQINLAEVLAHDTPSLPVGSRWRCRRVRASARRVDEEDVCRCVAIAGLGARRAAKGHAVELPILGCDAGRNINA
jgi:hypothetical protein